MITPNKAISYDASLFPKLPIILCRLNTPTTPVELYRDLHSNFADVSQFLLAIDTLFVLGRVTIENGELRIC